MVNVPHLDVFQYKEHVPYTTPGYHPGFREGSMFDNPFLSNFMPINPDAAPQMTRVAAEEMINGIEMFGFDGVRWDGHPRVGPSSRETAILLRYFKDIVNQRYPNFQHGYNCLPLSPEHDWGVENYELDELCRGGGLLMNEAQGNAVTGKTYELRLKVLQANGDLTRERGGYLLGTHGTHGMRAVRDKLCESIIKSVAGCRLQVAGARRIQNSIPT